MDPPEDPRNNIRALLNMASDQMRRNRLQPPSLVNGDGGGDRMSQALPKSFDPQRYNLSNRTGQMDMNRFLEVNYAHEEIANLQQDKVNASRQLANKWKNGRHIQNVPLPENIQLKQRIIEDMQGVFARENPVSMGATAKLLDVIFAANPSPTDKHLGAPVKYIQDIFDTLVTTRFGGIESKAKKRENRAFLIKFFTATNGYDSGGEDRILRDLFKLSDREQQNRQPQQQQQQQQQQPVQAIQDPDIQILPNLPPLRNRPLARAYDHAQFLHQQADNIEDEDDRAAKKLDLMIQTKFNKWMSSFVNTFDNTRNNPSGYVNEYMKKGIESNLFRNILRKVATYHNVADHESTPHNLTLRDFKIYRNRINPQTITNDQEFLAALKPEWSTLLQALKATDTIFNSSPELVLNVVRTSVNRQEKHINLKDGNKWQVHQYMPWTSGKLITKKVNDNGMTNRANPALTSVLSTYFDHLENNRRANNVQDSPDTDEEEEEQKFSSRNLVRRVNRREFDEEIHQPLQQQNDGGDDNPDFQFQEIADAIDRKDPDRHRKGVYNVVLTCQIENTTFRNVKTVKVFKIKIKVDADEYNAVKGDPTAVDDLFRNKILAWRQAKENLAEEYGNEDEFVSNINVIGVMIFSRHRPNRALKDVDFNMTAFCRGNIAAGMSEYVLYAQTTDVGICLYEAFCHIELCMTFLPEENCNALDKIKKKRTRHAIVAKAILEQFLDEPEDLKQAVLMGNPLQFYTLLKVYYPQIASITCIRFYENMDVSDLTKDEFGSEATSHFVILIKECHAFAIYTLGFENMKLKIKEKEDVLQYANKFNYNRVMVSQKPFEWIKKRKRKNKKGKKNKDGVDEEEEEKEVESDDENQIIARKREKQKKVVRRYFAEDIAEKSGEDSGDGDDDDEEEDIFDDEELDMVHINEKAEDKGEEKLRVYEKNILRLHDVSRFSAKMMDIETYSGGPDKMVDVEGKILKSLILNTEEEIADFEFIKLKYDHQNEFKLKTLTPNPRNKNIYDLTLDIETYNIPHPTDPKIKLMKPYLICVVNIHNNKEKIHFYGPDCIMFFLDWMDKGNIVNRKWKCDCSNQKSKTVNIWTFNGAKFDLQILLKDLLKRFPCKILDLNNLKSFIIKNVRFYDFYAIIKGSLRNIAKSFKVESQKGDFDHKRARPDTLNLIYLDATKYCYYDCIVLGQIVLKYFDYCETKSVSPYKISGSSLSMSIYLTNYYKDEYAITSLPAQIKPFIKLSYTGGACFMARLTNMSYQEVKSYRPTDFKQVIDKKTGDLKWIRACENEFEELNPVIKYYDINSSYPNVMEKYSFPTEFESIGRVSFEINSLDDFNEDALYVIKNFKFKKTVKYPFIQVKDHNGIIWYPLNYNNGFKVIWGSELAMGFKYDLFDMEENPIQCQMELIFKCKKIFKEFIDLAYKERLEAKLKGDSVADAFTKLRMNSLYGKFGQKDYPMFIILLEELLTYESKMSLNLTRTCKEVRTSRCLRNIKDVENIEELNDGVYKMELEINKAPCYNHIASAVTSRARQHLFQGIYCSEGERFYCDTDSQMIIGDIDPDLVDNATLGKWKLECAVKRGIFLGSKFYMLETDEGEIIMKAKGIPKKYLCPDLYYKLLESCMTNTFDNVTNVTSFLIPCGEFFARDTYEGMFAKSIEKKLRVTTRRAIYRDGTTCPPYEVGKFFHPEVTIDINHLSVVEEVNFIATPVLDLEKKDYPDIIEQRYNLDEEEHGIDDEGYSQDD
jgi:DNA polymerase type B, organellar and viral